MTVEFQLLLEGKPGVGVIVRAAPLESLENHYVAEQRPALNTVQAGKDLQRM